MEDCLKKLITDDPSVVESCLQKYSDLDYPSNASVIRRYAFVFFFINWQKDIINFHRWFTFNLFRTETLNKCFSLDTVEEIIDTLESEAGKTNDGWCDSILKKLKYASPLSLKVALRSIREGRFQTLDQCLIREYRMSLQGVAGQVSSDLHEVLPSLLHLVVKIRSGEMDGSRAWVID
ncbi:putative 3-hydroxyisobutyryl-CoA hydrolase [Helianthus annuus]|nr:putative 3-hydroxyisobutyryl-CoA hydrolase [Helianthus annuus]